MSANAVLLPVEHLLPPPDPQERRAGFAVMRAVGSLMYAVGTEKATLGFEVENPLKLLAQTEATARERVDRMVLATAQHSRTASVPERTVYLSRSFMPCDSQDVTSASPYGPPVKPQEGGLKYSFGYSADGEALNVVEAVEDKKEAAAHALTVQESHRLAEERQFTPDEELVVWHALKYMARKGKTKYDRREAKTLLKTMFEFEGTASRCVNAVVQWLHARTPRSRDGAHRPEQPATGPLHQSSNTRLAERLPRRHRRRASVLGGRPYPRSTASGQGANHRSRHRVFAGHSS